MQNKKLAVFSALALALVSSAFAQLIVTPQGATSLATSINASASDQTKLDTIGTTMPASVTIGGLEFSLIPNLDTYTVSPGFFADVSFVGRNEVDVDNLFVQATVGAPISLYSPWTESSKAVSFHLTGNTDFSLMFQDSSFGSHSLFSQSDPLSVVFYEAIDVAHNRLIDLLLVDDRRTEYIDFNDGRFLVETNLNPVGIEPVPEPSTYGLIGASVLLGLVAFRRRMSHRNA